jgi:pullulanase
MALLNVASAQEALWLTRHSIAVKSTAPEESWTLETEAGNFPLEETGERVEEPLYIKGFRILKLGDCDVQKAVRGAMTLVGGEYRTTLQISGVLDDVFGYDGPLGPTVEGDTVTLRLWAPTAKYVKLHIAGLSVDMTEYGGVWSASGEWKNEAYGYEVVVYAPSTGKVEHNFVTDPYSLGLVLNSRESVAVDLNDAEQKPEGWDQLPKPAPVEFTDWSVYELHVRDFSIGDMTVPAEHRGAYLAFTHPESNGMRHLRALAKAGLKAIHLLPTFDIATVEEDWTKQKTTGDLSRYPADSEKQQEAVHAIKHDDGFNWGYDPLHFTTPEGSYAVDAARRTLEYRQMVMALNQAGLRVVADVVYNHTYRHGQDPLAVLDRIVPGYYHRLDLQGNVLTSTCCSNTATEHRMMRKLMVNSMVTWATQYKIDGFRFDLMGHHMVEDIRQVRQALNRLTVEHDGVDGKQIYLYGEGWDFGEVSQDARGLNASQKNMFGEGVGTFNDRMRDAARGGTPFGDSREQGWITGNPTDHEKELLELSLAGNLRDFVINGRPGGEIEYNGKMAGYAASPIETVNYVSAHDNETLFDAIQMKAPAAESIDLRVRRNDLGVSLVALGHGIPFFHAGDDMLRSKSLDRNSYDSGDWFNKLDFTYQTNNWGVGLPLQEDNGMEWPVMKPLLANPALRVRPELIVRARDHFREMLAIRYGSPDFRTGKVEFLDAPVSLIVMGLGEHIVVVFNASTETQTATISPDLGLHLHPVLAASTDELVRQAEYRDDGQITVPGLTTAVFVKP